LGGKQQREALMPPFVVYGIMTVSLSYDVQSLEALGQLLHGIIYLFFGVGCH
jgi:hypothetical protein